MTQTKKLGVLEAYGRGWQSFKDNWMVLVAFILVAGMITAVLDTYGYEPAERHAVPVEVAEAYQAGGISQEVLVETAIELKVQQWFGEMSDDVSVTVVTIPSSGSLVLTILGVFVNILVSVMGIAIMIQAARGKTISYESVMESLSVKKVLVYLIASILVSIAVVLGLILLIVPGVILMLMFSMTYFLVVDQDMGPIEAMKKSKKITKGYRWQILGVTLLAIPLLILGALALLVGLLVVIPWIGQTMAQVYLYLLEAGPLGAKLEESGEESHNEEKTGKA